mmetsp:Transcript_11486/g.28984  ORF Transcript_11486/g.28984 Transcript_11486/m.28984 type:complete len:217 (+) Transcript_11486:76-726(+)
MKAPRPHCPCFLLLLTIGAPGPATAGGALRGWELDHHPWGQGDSTGEGEASKGDFMDQYIAASGASKSGTAWWEAPTGGKPSSSNDDAMSWVHEQVQRQRQSQSSPTDDANDHADGMLHSLSAVGTDQASASNDAGSGGAVVDIRLDSELQEQAHAKGSRQRTSVAMLQARAAPNVEDAVAEQRLEDVYIHDPFSAASAADVKEEQRLKASRDFKP